MNLRRIDGKDSLAFVVEVTEVKDELDKRAQKKLSDLPVVQRNISAGKMTKPKVRLVGLGGLKRSVRAKKMIVDSR